MPSQVWLRFEKKKEDGSVMKFRIQDLPPERIGEATELMVKYFARDEPIRNSFGFTKNPKSLEEYRKHVEASFRVSRNVMCCEDTDEDNSTIMAISSIVEASPSNLAWDKDAGEVTDETKKLNEMYHSVVKSFDVFKELKINTCYFGKSMLVLPEYRRNGIAEKLLTVRRLMCAAHGIPLTAAWMTNLGSQGAATRDGWETVHEISYEEASSQFDVKFENVPPTAKLMVGRAHPNYPIVTTA